MIAQEWLGKVPKLSGQRESTPDGVGNGQALAKLRAADLGVNEFVEYGVRVVVKTLYVGAGQEQEGIGRTAKIEFGRATVISAMEIAHGYRGRRALALVYDRLSANKYFGRAVCGVAGYGVVDPGLGGSQQFQAGRDGKLDDFVKGKAGRELR